MLWSWSNPIFCLASSASSSTNHKCVENWGRWIMFRSAGVSKSWAIHKVVLFVHTEFVVWSSLLLLWICVWLACYDPSFGDLLHRLMMCGAHILLLLWMLYHAMANQFVHSMRLSWFALCLYHLGMTPMLKIDIFPGGMSMQFRTCTQLSILVVQVLMHLVDSRIKISLMLGFTP